MVQNKALLFPRPAVLCNGKLRVLSLPTRSVTAAVEAASPGSPGEGQPRADTTLLSYLPGLLWHMFELANEERSWAILNQLPSAAETLSAEMDGDPEVKTLDATALQSEHLLLQVRSKTTGDCMTKIVVGSLR